MPVAAACPDIAAGAADRQMGSEGHATHRADSALRIEWDQPEKPVLLLPKLGTEWTDADQATLAEGLGSSVHSPEPDR
jgi:hypothetical protein